MPNNFHSPEKDINAAIARAKVWWRSRTPEERESGIDAWLDKITPIVCITVPVPFCGVVEVFSTSMKRSRKITVKVSKRAYLSLKGLFLNPSLKKWRVKVYPKAVLFFHGGELVKRGDRRHGGRF